MVLLTRTSQLYGEMERFLTWMPACLRASLMSIYKLFNRTRKRLRLLSWTFSGVMRFRVSVRTCVTVQCIHISTWGRCIILDCFSLYCAQETISLHVTKYTRFWSLPTILIVMLNRATMTGKNKCCVVSPLIMDLSKYVIGYNPISYV